MEWMFSLLNDYTFRIVALGSALLGVTSGIIGCYAILKKESLLGDGVSHSALPGVVLAFLLTGRKETTILLFGALCTGLLASLLIKLIVSNSKINFDSALALVMSVFFGLGMTLLTYSQQTPNANQAGLNRFIYGQASTLLVSDVYLIGIVCILLILTVVVFWKEFKVVVFDSVFASIIGYPSKIINNLLTFLMVIVVIVGLQSVGVILMSAMIIAPSVAARQWTNKLSVMVFLSAVFGCISGVIGTAISSSLTQIPTGPTIVVCLSIIALFSILFAPKRGIIHKLYVRAKTRNALKQGKEIQL